MNNQLIKISVIIGFITFLSSVFIFTYWNEFGINIFEYIPVSDLPIQGIYTLIKDSWVFIITSFFSIFFLQKTYPYGGYQEKLENGEINTFDKVLKWILGILLFGMFPMVILWIFIIKNYNLFYQLLPFAIAPFTVFLSNELFKKRILPHGTFYATLIRLAVILFVMSITTAKRKALLINNSTSFEYINYKNKNYKLLGKAGEYFFLSNPDLKSIRFIQKEELKDFDKINFSFPPKSKADSSIYNYFNKIKNSSQEGI